MSTVGTSQSLGQHAIVRKGGNAPQFCPPPGPELWTAIEQRSRGRPVYRVADGLFVPRLTWTAEAHHYDAEPQAVGIRADVASNLDGERGGARRVETSRRSRSQLARLTAAVYRDIGDSNLCQISEHFGYGGNQTSRERAARRDVAEGRRLWVVVGGWPWWSIARATGNRDLTGGPPPDWWMLTEVAETLDHYVKAG
jgi:hypothetical protein